MPALTANEAPAAGRAVYFFNGLLIYSPADGARAGGASEPGRRIHHIRRVLIRGFVVVDIGRPVAHNVLADAQRGRSGKRRADHANQET